MAKERERLPSASAHEADDEGRRHFLRSAVLGGVVLLGRQTSVAQIQAVTRYQSRHPAERHAWNIVAQHRRLLARRRPDLLEAADRLADWPKSERHLRLWGTLATLRQRAAALGAKPAIRNAAVDLQSLVIDQRQRFPEDRELIELWAQTEELLIGLGDLDRRGLDTRAHLLEAFWLARCDYRRALLMRQLRFNLVRHGRGSDRLFKQLARGHDDLLETYGHHVPKRDVAWLRHQRRRIEMLARAREGDDPSETVLDGLRGLAEESHSWLLNFEALLDRVGWRRRDAEDHLTDAWRQLLRDAPATPQDAPSIPVTEVRGFVALSRQVTGEVRDLNPRLLTVFRMRKLLGAAIELHLRMNPHTALPLITVYVRNVGPDENAHESARLRRWGPRVGERLPRIIDSFWSPGPVPWFELIGFEDPE
jgi:hypothetical protein